MRRHARRPAISARPYSANTVPHNVNAAEATQDKMSLFAGCKRQSPLPAEIFLAHRKPCGFPPELRSGARFMCLGTGLGRGSKPEGPKPLAGSVRDSSPGRGGSVRCPVFDNDDEKRVSGDYRTSSGMESTAQRLGMLQCWPTARGVNGLDQTMIQDISV